MFGLSRDDKMMINKSGERNNKLIVVYRYISTDITSQSCHCCVRLIPSFC